MQRVNAENPTVLIIGAGPAGVAAASRLLENNITNLQIVEAEPRIGGRIRSVRFGDAFIDLGAEWCHGEEGNIVYSMVKNLNVLNNDEFQKRIVYSTGEELDEEFCTAINDVFEDLYEKNNDVPKNGRTLGEYFHAEYDSRISKVFEGNETKLEVAKKARKLFDRFIMSTEGSNSVFDPSAEMDYVDNEGNLGLSWNGTGFATILDVLIKKFPNPSEELPFYEKLHLNKTVSKIIWNDPDMVTVEFTDTSRMSAEHVIFTPSLGVLKHDHEKIFDPPLPRAKVGVINELGFGGVAKIAMYFPEKWWGSEEFGDTALLWDEKDEIEVSEEFTEGPQENGLSWITNIFAILQPENNQNVLMVWLAGPLISEIEKLSGETITKGVMVVLNKFF